MVRCLALLLSALATADAASAATLVDTSVTRDAASRSVLFEVEFSDPPELFTGDEHNRSTDGFQFFVDPRNGVRPAATFSILVRGEELKYGGDLRIRDRDPESTDPESGGWGPLRGVVPFHQSGSLVSFAVPWALLDTKDGYISYQLLTTTYGYPTGVRYGSTAAPVPLPPAIGLIAAAMAAFGALGLRAGGRRRSAA